MTTINVAAFVNVATEGLRPIGFAGYEHGQTVAFVGIFQVDTADESDPADALETMFAIGNRQGSDLSGGQSWPEDVRSLSVGDLVLVGEQYYAVASFGFDKVETPPNECIVPVAGTIATSRPAPVIA